MPLESARKVLCRSAARNAEEYDGFGVPPRVSEAATRKVFHRAGLSQVVGGIMKMNIHLCCCIIATLGALFFTLLGWNARDIDLLVIGLLSIAGPVSLGIWFLIAMYLRSRSGHRILVIISSATLQVAEVLNYGSTLIAIFGFAMWLLGAELAVESSPSEDSNPQAIRGIITLYGIWFAYGLFRACYRRIADGDWRNYSDKMAMKP